MPLPFTFFVKTTAIVGTPTDILTGVAPGRDPLGCALVNAGYDHTGGTVERQVTAASGTPFANVQVGDYLYLLNAVGGVADGLYEVEAVNSNTVIGLVADSGLTADSTADVDSSDGPWATIQYGFDNTTATGDQLVICADGNGTGTDWEPTVALDIDTNAGGVLGIHVRGATSRGVVDGTKTTISGASLGASTVLVQITASDDWNFYDLRITGASSHNVSSGNFGQSRFTFVRCRLDGAVGASSDGYSGDAENLLFMDCEVDGNGRDGIRGIGSTRMEDLVCTNCLIHDNGGNGIHGGRHVKILRSAIYSNGGLGYEIDQDVSGIIVDRSVFFGNIGDGLGVSSAALLTSGYSIRNSIFRSNGGYGISLGSFNRVFFNVESNCFSNNTSGAMDSSGQGVVPFPGPSPGNDTNIYADPLFVDETAGSEDFNTQAGSPCRAAAIGY